MSIGKQKMKSRIKFLVYSLKGGTSTAVNLISDVQLQSSQNPEENVQWDENDENNVTIRKIHVRF